VPSIIFMELSMKSFLFCIFGFAWTLMMPAATAQTKFPTQPIKVIVPFAAGGLADISMRLVGQKLSERIGQNVIIENRPGAGGVIASNTALAAARDGHTLILFANGTAIAKSLFKLPFDPVADFVPITSMAWFDLVLLTKGDGAIKTVADVLELAKKRPLNLGSINPGSTQNLSAELFKNQAKVNATVIPFKSTPEVVTGILRGDIDVGFESYATVKGQIEAGQIRVIAVSGTSRAPWLPQTPTVRESGLASYDVTGWNALFAPAGVPADVVQMLNRHLNEVLQMPEVKNRLRELGTIARGNTTSEMTQQFSSDITKWAAVIKQAGIQQQ
jgi:tripartite-type tricarboxylate transporter receptor subunit TctC